MKTVFIGRKQLTVCNRMRWATKGLAIMQSVAILFLQLLRKLICRIEKNDFNTISGKSYGPEKSKRIDRYNEGK